MCFFCTGDEYYEISENEKRKWQLRKIYYDLHASFDETGSFVYPSELPEDFPVEIQIAGNIFEISCPASDQQDRIILFSDGQVKRRKGTNT